MDKKLTGLLSLFFLSFALFAVMVVFQEPLSHLTRAKEEFEASGDHSLMFAWPLSAVADGKSGSTITVFVRSTKGRPLSNKTVAVSSSLGQVQSIETTSDKEGKATFRVISDTPGIAEIQAVIDNNVPITQKVTVKFTAPEETTKPNLRLTSTPPPAEKGETGTPAARPTGLE